MKFFVVLLVGVSFSMFGEKTEDVGIDAKSSIKTVTVFSDRARVTRVSEIALKKGLNIFDISGIPEKLDDSSLTVALPKSVDAVLLSVEIPRKYGSKLDPKELQEIEKKKDELSQQLSLLQKRKRQLQNNISTIKQLNIGIAPSERDVKPAILTPDTWKTFLNFTSEQLANCAKSIRNIDKQSFDLGQEYEVVKNKYSKLVSYRRKSQKIARVKINSLVEQSIKIDFSYIIYNASWFPIYDIHVDPKTAEVSMSYFAQIAQKTGEDWSDTKIIMSTAIPAQSADLPKLQTTLIQEKVNTSPVRQSRSRSSFGINKMLSNNFQSPMCQINTSNINSGLRITKNKSKKQVGYINESNKFNMRTSQSASLISNFSNDAFSNIQVKGGKSYNGNRLNISGSNVFLNDKDGNVISFKLDDIETIDNKIRQGQGKGANKNWLVEPSKSAGGFDYRFPAAKLETIKSNGKVYRVLLKSSILKGNKEYFASPIASPYAFLRCKTVNTTKTPILAGASNIFLGGDFIGEARLHTVPENGLFILDLGIDERLVVRRASSRMSKTRGIISKNRRIELENEISIVNYIKEDINIVIEERLPISYNKNISIIDFKENKKSFNRDKKGKYYNGLVHWKVNVKGGKTEKVISSYAIEYPLNFEITNKIGRGHYQSGLGKQIMKASKK